MIATTMAQPTSHWRNSLPADACSLRSYSPSPGKVRIHLQRLGAHSGSIPAEIGRGCDHRGVVGAVRQRRCAHVDADRCCPASEFLSQARIGRNPARERHEPDAEIVRGLQRLRAERVDHCFLEACGNICRALVSVAGMRLQMIAYRGLQPGETEIVRSIPD